MHAGDLDMPENAADDDRALVWVGEASRVGNAIHIDLGGAFEKFIDQHRPLRRSLDCESHVMLQLAIRINDLHGTPAQNEAGPHQYRITQLARHGERLGFGRWHSLFRTWTYSPPN